MAQLVELFVTRSLQYVREEIRLALSPIAPYLRKLGVGLLLVLMSALAWFAGLIFFLLTLFFYFADVAKWLYPALWTGLVSWAVAIIFVLWGMSFLKKPEL